MKYIKSNYMLGSMLIFCSLFIAQLNAKSLSGLVGPFGEHEAFVIEVLKENDWVKLELLFQKTLSWPEEAEWCSAAAPFLFLRGHAALATGNNNLAVECFYFSCGSKEETRRSRESWLKWTEVQLINHSESAAFHYLYGDALARLNQMEKAILSFNKAIQEDRDFALAYNARGLTKFLIHLQDPEKYELDAYEDLSLSIQKDPHLADAHANKGLMKILEKRSSESAMAALDEALKIDPDYNLAAGTKAYLYGINGKNTQFERISKELQLKKSNAFDRLLKESTREKVDGQDPLLGQTTTQNQFKIGGGIRWGNPFFGPSGTFSTNFSRTTYTNHLGGVYGYLKNGENIQLTKEGEKVMIGTWFALHYPGRIMPEDYK